MIEHDRLAAALALAHEAHRVQKRKGTDIPYIAHPMAVASLVFTHGGTEDQAIAALLHDTIEDAGEAYAERIGAAFGPDVLAVVRDCTDGSFENKAAARTPEAKFANWRQRKLAYIDHLRSMSADSPALLVSACDKLDNARAILADLRLLGPTLFERFTGRREGTLWYYDQLAGIFLDKRVAPATALNRAVAAMGSLTEYRSMQIPVHPPYPPETVCVDGYLVHVDVRARTSHQAADDQGGRVPCLP